MTDPTIQAPAGPPPDATGDIVVSFSEVDAMVRKAARGAGYAWGMAEEAGRAARWLVAHGTEGPTLFNDLLTLVDGRTEEFTPDVSRSPWMSASGVICPVSAGAALSDRAANFAAGSTLALGETAFPVVLAPFLTWIASTRNLTIVIKAGGASAKLHAAGQSQEGLEDLARVDRGAVNLTLFAVSSGSMLEKSSRGVPVEVGRWRRLSDFAARTYVPTNEQSRRSGAGAGTSDND
ncbi:MAG: DUF3726 domain-containing protein [Rhodospirillales bacterium]